ncbi:MAG: outer membrane lipoprotein LolB [Methyloprofundus sp.]|nr:outer membrane lipoprotein LolB [Methyloprofundus sp.]
MLRNENSIIPEPDLSFDFTVALKKQLRSLLCACFPGASVKPEYCAILSDFIKFSYLKSILCLVLLSVLAACTTIHTYDAQLGRELKKQQKIELQKWSLQGRLLIKSDDVLTANIQWQHENKNDVLRLFGALGMGAMLIELNDHEIMLDTGNGKKQVSQEIDAFIARQIGFVVPLTALRRWVVGDYLQDVPVLQMENGFQQLGWQVIYNEYMDTAIGVMPRKIKISKDKIKLKLVVDQWSIE